VTMAEHHDFTYGVSSRVRQPPNTDI
jgi:hypothetical protein